jgi:hypothetical protein
MSSFDLQPHLAGDLLDLRPLRPEDWEGLFAAAADPLIWELHPAHDRYQEDVFREYFREALASRRALEKIGAVLTDRRDTRTLHGRLVEHVVYQIEKLDRASDKLTAIR